MPLCPGFHKNVSFAKWTNQIAEIINFLGSTTLCLTRFAASLLELNSCGWLNKHNIMHYFSYINSKWVRQTHQYHTNFGIFRSLAQFWTNCQIITICRYFMTCCKFGTSHEHLYSYFGIFCVSQNNFHWYKINLIKSSFALPIMITQNQRTNQRAAAKRHYSSSIGVESRTNTVVESKTRSTSKGNFVLDSTTFLNFRVWDSTKSSNL